MISFAGLPPAKLKRQSRTGCRNGLLSREQFNQEETNLTRLKCIKNLCCSYMYRMTIRILIYAYRWISCFCLCHLNLFINHCIFCVFDQKYNNTGKYYNALYLFTTLIHLKCTLFINYIYHFSKYLYIFLRNIIHVYYMILSNFIFSNIII